MRRFLVPVLIAVASGLGAAGGALAGSGSHPHPIRWHRVDAPDYSATVWTACTTWRRTPYRLFLAHEGGSYEGEGVGVGFTAVIDKGCAR